MDAVSTILNVRSAAAWTGASVHVGCAPSSGYVPREAVCAVILRGLKGCQSLSGFWRLAKIQGSSLRYTLHACRKPETGKISDCEASRRNGEDVDVSMGFMVSMQRSRPDEGIVQPRIKYLHGLLCQRSHV